MNVRPRSKIIVSGTCTLVAILLLPVKLCAGQPTNCSDGIVRFAGNVNGQITLCSTVAAQAPDLATKFTELQKSVGAQQLQVKELIRLVRGLNKAGNDLVLPKQIELLRNVLTRLGDPQTTGLGEFQSRSSKLSSHFEQVSTEISTVLNDPKTSARTKAALQGSAGDAISRLDFETATEQLDQISAQLNLLNGKVDSVNETTRSTQQIVEAMRQDQLLTEKQQQEHAAEAAKAVVEQQKQMEEQREKAAESQVQVQKDLAEKQLKDPKNFVTVKLTAIGSSTSPPWAATVYVAHHGDALVDARLEVVFQMSRGVQVVRFPVASRIDGLQKPNVKLSAIGSKATVCISAVDPRTSSRRLWKADFESQVHDMGIVTTADYVPSSDISLTPDDGITCALDPVLAASRGSDLQPLAGFAPLSGGTRSVSSGSSRIPASASPPVDEGVILYRAHRYSEALPLLEHAADSGDGHSAMIVGGMYIAGEGVPKDSDRAMYWWRKGADAGDPMSMADLAASYTSTQGGHKPDYVEAARWYKRAAAAGEPSGMTGVALMYLNGQGGYPHDDAQAAAWFRKAAEEGNSFGSRRIKIPTLKKNKRIVNFLRTASATEKRPSSPSAIIQASSAFPPHGSQPSCNSLPVRKLTAAMPMARTERIVSKIHP